MGNENRLMTASEVAEYLGMHVQTVYEKTASGAIPHVRLGRTIRYRPEDLNDWLKRKTVAPTDDATAADPAA